MIDGDPVELGAEVARGLAHEIAGEGAQVLHLARVLWRDDEPEMMPVVFAACGKVALVDGVVLRAEHRCVAAVLGHTIAL